MSIPIWLIFVSPTLLGMAVGILANLDELLKPIAYSSIPIKFPESAKDSKAKKKPPPSRGEHRRRASQKENQGRVWGVFTGIGASIVLPFLPRIPVVIAVALVVLWFASWPMARSGYKHRAPMTWVLFIMLGHGSILVLVGYWVWPRITISPSRVSFLGYPNETFNFSVRNGRADDVYDVQIPFFIGRNKHFENKLSARVLGNVEPSGPFRDDYNYCFGVKGDGVVSHVQKNEQEVLIVRLPHLVPYGSGAFSITYAGGDKLPDITAGTVSFIEEPYSYSPDSGTVGVRGDYRICKFVMSPSGQ